MAPAAKKIKVDPNVAGVEESLEFALDISDETRQMILAGLAKSLVVPRDQRHECQEKMVNMIGDIIFNVKDKFTEAAEREANNVSDIENSHGELQGRLEQAAQAKEAAGAVVKQEEQNLQQAAEAAVTAKESLKAQQKLSVTTEAELKKAGARATLFSKAFEEDFKALTEEDGQDGKMHHKALEPVLKDLGLEESLQLALPSACAKKIVERSSFDTMVLQQLGAQLQEHVALTQQDLLQSQAKLQEIEAAIEIAKADIERTTQAQQAVADDLAKARAHQRETAAEEQSAREAKDTFEQRLNDAKALRDAQALTLSNFKMYNIMCFENLRDQTTPADKTAAMETPADAVESPAVGGA